MIIHPQYPAQLANRWSWSWWKAKWRAGDPLVDLPPYQGVPENAAAWLFRVAHNSAIDAVRHRRMLGDKTDAIVAELYQAVSAPPDDPDLEEQLRDDELRLILMCCHPEIPRDARVALSLKTVGGFGVREIARAFLAEDTAIAQRLVRAKRQIRDGHLTLEMPHGAELVQRLDSVLEVIYFMFNEGYAAHAGEDLVVLITFDSAFRYAALRRARIMGTASEFGSSPN